LLRFGDVQVLFEPTDADDAMAWPGAGGKHQGPAGDETVAAREAGSPSRPPPPARRRRSSRRAPDAPEAAHGRPAGAPQPKKGKGCGGSAAVLLVVAAACVYWFLA